MLLLISETPLGIPQTSHGHGLERSNVWLLGCLPAPPTRWSRDEFSVVQSAESKKVSTSQKQKVLAEDSVPQYWITRAWNLPTCIYDATHAHTRVVCHFVQQWPLAPRVLMQTSHPLTDTSCRRSDTTVAGHMLQIMGMVRFICGALLVCCEEDRHLAILNPYPST